MALDDGFGQTSIDYQMQLANLAAQRGMANLHNAHAEEAMMNAAQTKAFMEALKSPAQGESVQMAGGGAFASAMPQQDPIDSVAGKLAELSNRVVGVAPIQGGKIAAQAAGLRQHAAQTRSNQVTQRWHELQQKQIVMGDLSQALAGATDGPSWNAALLSFQARHPGEEIPPQLATYNPRMADAIRNGTTQGLKVLQQQLREEAQAAKEGYQADRLRFMEERLQFQRDKADADRAARGRNAKVDGPKAVGAPTKGELDAANGAIGDTYPDLPVEERDRYAFTIAARAKALGKNTPGMDADAALDQALGESAQKGEIKKVNEAYKFFGIEVPKSIASKDVTRFAKPKPGAGSAGGPDLSQAASVKSDLKSGKISRDEAVKRLKALGFD